MKIRRLWQPRNPLFWLMVVLNLLSALGVVLAQHQAYPPLVLLLLAAFAIANAWLGWRIACILLRDAPLRETHTPPRMPADEA